MPDMDWLYAAIVLFLVFGGGGWATREASRALEHRRTMRRHKAGFLPDAVCGCGHHLSFHTPKDGCHHTEPIIATSREPVRDAAGNPVRDQFGDVKMTTVKSVEGEQVCGCQRYVGPEPIATLFSPDMAAGAVEEPQQPKQLSTNDG